MTFGYIAGRHVAGATAYEDAHPKEDKMTRYELATMKIGFGAGRKAAEAIAAYRLRAGAGGKLLGCWFSDIGDLNKIAVLRGFADDAELLRERDRTFGAAIRSAAATS